MRVALERGIRLNDSHEKSLRMLYNSHRNQHAWQKQIKNRKEYSCVFNELDSRSFPYLIINRTHREVFHFNLLDHLQRHLSLKWLHTQSVRNIIIIIPFMVIFWNHCTELYPTEFPPESKQCDMDSLVTLSYSIKNWSQISSLSSSWARHGVVFVIHEHRTILAIKT